MHYVYMIKNRSGKLYIGVSKNPEQRVKEHNSRRGSIYTESGWFTIVFLEQYQILSGARKREIQLKKWRREKKDALISRYQQGLPTKLHS